MKRILVFTTILIITFSSLTKAQLTMHKMVHAGYVYQNQSFGEIGLRFLFLSSDDLIYRLGASALMGVANKEFVIMPKVQGDILLNFERNIDLYHSYYFLAGAEVATKYVAPKIGASFFGIIDITAGYGFSLDKKGINGKELKGLNLNFTLNIPLVLLRDLSN